MLTHEDVTQIALLARLRLLPEELDQLILADAILARQAERARRSARQAVVGPGPGHDRR